jgi:hypothetical protein
MTALAPHRPEAVRAISREQATAMSSFVIVRSFQMKKAGAFFGERHVLIAGNTVDLADITLLMCRLSGLQKTLLQS